MNDINKLFFELIRVAIGTQVTLSRPPSRNEWAELYAMSKKQSLIGICFAAVQKLQCNDNQEPRTKNPQSEPTHNHEPITKNLDEVQYLTWMGMAAKIQQRNEVVNRQCAELQAKLSADEFRSCILKGQGVAASYGSLSLLRQSGDIDLWVDGDIKDTISRFKQLGIELSNINIKHADAHFFDDTEVEIHFRPSWFYSPIKDKRLRKWFKEQKSIQMNHRIGDMCAPDIEFNLIYLLLHTYRHMLDEGVGLRQVMDYYMVLRTVPEGFKFQKVSSTLNLLGLMKFAGAMMWVMRVVFGLPDDLQICDPNEKSGRMLLKDIMQSGNFGHYDTNRKHFSSDWFNGLNNFKRNLRYVTNYPSEVLWAPIWKVWHWMYRKLYFN